MIYETLYIVPSKYSDTELADIQGGVNALFEKHGAEVKKTDVLGKIKFAYPIKKEQHGTYVLAYFEAEGEAMTKIDQELRLADEVLRHVIVKREKGIPSESFELSAYQPPLTSEGKRAEKRAPRIETPVAPKPVALEDQMSGEELEKKLDEILEGDVMTDV